MDDKDRHSGLIRLHILMKQGAMFALCVLGAAAGCSQGGAPPPPAGGATAAPTAGAMAAPAEHAPADRGPAPRYGAVMAEVGRRFELAGRASAAGRFELASFEIEEMEELFEEDLPRAAPPKEGSSTSLPGIADAFLKTHLPELKKAAAAGDQAAFADAFQRAAGTCNACHKTSGHGFIEIPSVPGKAVPDIDPPRAPGEAR